MVTQDGGEGDDLITALDVAALLADSAKTIVARLVDRGWETVNHSKGSVCKMYRDGSTLVLYQDPYRLHRFIARGPRAAVNDAVVAGREMVDWR